ncbi:hypothetical protein BVX99_00865 [bacterium F16]|nr:hypothetical protein BVX99_00865 [bacterium F16]
MKDIWSRVRWGRIGLHGGLLSLVSVLTGCAKIDEFKTNPWGMRLIDHAPGLTWSLVKWTVLGGVIAAPVALLAFFAVRRVGGFRWKWRHAKYMRILTCIGLLLCTVACGALIGFNEGLYRGLRDVVESTALKKDLRPAGGTGADVVGAIYIITVRTPPEELAAVLEQEMATHPPNKATSKENTDGSTGEDATNVAAVAPVTNEPRQDPVDDKDVPPEKTGDARQALETRIQDDLETFRNGEWDVDIRLLENRLKEIKSGALHSVLPGIKDQIRKTLPSLNEGNDAQIFDWFVDTFGEMLLTKIVEDKLADNKLNEPVLMIWDGLESAAGESGNPETISYDTLSGYLPSCALQATLIYPAKGMVRGNQISLAIIWGILLLGLVLLFQLAEFLRSRNILGRTWSRVTSGTNVEDDPQQSLNDGN